MLNLTYKCFLYYKLLRNDKKFAASIWPKTVMHAIDIRWFCEWWKSSHFEI